MANSSSSSSVTVADSIAAQTIELIDTPAKAPDPQDINDSNKEFRCLRHNGCVFHDIFISYRVNTEKRIADKLALLLDTYTKKDGQKIKTFLDSNCLLDGGNWEKNFLSALHHSKLVVLVISEAGLDLPSFSAPGLTKIQNAGKEQDNCLLEYEECLALKESGQIDILVLCVAQEGKLAGRSCKIKFPTTSSGLIGARLGMYSESGPHKHRSGKLGPPVRETMEKLLGLLTPAEPKHAPNYSHLDPDDIPSRIPDILWKLSEYEKRVKITTKISRYIQDVNHFKVKVGGALIGMILPLFSLLVGFGAISPRQKSLYFGVIVGHGIDLLAGAFYVWDSWYNAIPQDCLLYGCDIEHLLLRKDFYPIFDEYCGYALDYPDKFDIYNETQVDCFCAGWQYQCTADDYVRDMYMFLGVLLVVISVSTILYARALEKSFAAKKYRTRGGV